MIFPGAEEQLPARIYGNRRQSTGVSWQLALALGRRGLGRTHAQSRRRRGRRQGRRHRRPGLDATGRPSPCRAGGAGAGRERGARRHTLCDARALFAFRQVAALRRRRHRRRHHTRGVGDRGPQSGSGGAGPREVARCRDCGRYRTLRGGSSLRSCRTFPARPREASACDPEAGGLHRRQDCS